MPRHVKAGSPELRKVLQRFPGFTLVSAGGTGGHANMLDPSGRLVRLQDGRKLTVICSPRNDHDEARELMRRLKSLGIEAR